MDLGERGMDGEGENWLYVGEDGDGGRYVWELVLREARDLEMKFGRRKGGELYFRYLPNGT